jgi:cell division protein FtsB
MRDVGRYVRERWVAFLLWAVSAAMAASALTGEQGLLQVIHLRQHLAAADERNFGLLQSIDQIQGQLQALREDDRELARVARKRLSLTQPGEVLYRLPGEERPLPRAASDGAAR